MGSGRLRRRAHRNLPDDGLRGNDGPWRNDGSRATRGPRPSAHHHHPAYSVGITPKRGNDFQLTVAAAASSMASSAISRRCHA